MAGFSRASAAAVETTYSDSGVNTEDAAESMRRFASMFSKTLQPQSGFKTKFTAQNGFSSTQSETGFSQQL